MVTYLHVRASNDRSVKGRLHLGHLVFPCIIGRNGRTFRKVEGDGKTPIGTFTLRRGFYRADRVNRPSPGLSRLKMTDGWCEVPGSGFYNRHVKLPFRHGHETCGVEMRPMTSFSPQATMSVQGCRALAVPSSFI